MNKAIALLITALLIASACVSCVSGTSETGVWRCPPLPETFQESDLIGTWQGEYGASTDTLIIRERVYKQIYIRHTDSYRYESPWNRWWLERQPSGGLYLHLEGMHRCDQIDELCYQEGGGGGDWAYWDFCADRRVEMPGEVVLMVTGVPEGNSSAPRGIWLWHMAPSRESGAFHFTLREE